MCLRHECSDGVAALTALARPHARTDRRLDLIWIGRPPQRRLPDLVGGLALAAFELAEAAGVGVHLDSDATPELFGEDQARYLVACNFDQAEALMTAAGHAGVPIAYVGRIHGIDVRIGGSLDPSSTAVETEAEVVFVLPTDDDYLREAVVRIGGIDLVLAARRRPFHNIEDFTRLGLDPRSAKIVVVKSGYLSPDLGPIANPSLMALSPGVVDQFVERLERKHKNVAQYPFDKDFAWAPDVKWSSRASQG